MEAQDITSRYFPSHVSMPDGNLAIPLTQIEFTYGRNDMMDTANAVPHALASPDTLIMEETTLQATNNALTNKSITDFFINRKLHKGSNWSQISMLLMSKLRTAGVLSIIKRLSDTPVCGPPILNPIDDTVISLTDFTQVERDVEAHHFQIMLNSWNRINNLVCDLLISSVQPDAGPTSSLLPILMTNSLLDSDHNTNIPASLIYETLSRFFIEKMGTCEQIKSKCHTISSTLPRDSQVNVVDSALRMLFSDYKLRDNQKRDLDESQKISYLITAFNLHSDHRMRACSSDLSLKLRVGDVLSYERAVINLTHTENEIHGHELSTALANTISNQYSLQSDHHLATTMQHDTHINLIQSSKKRSRNFDRTSLYDRRHERIINEDPNPAPRMNRYGYDGPNRH